MSDLFPIREPRAGGGTVTVAHGCPFVGCVHWLTCRGVREHHTFEGCADFHPWLARHLEARHPGWTVDDLKEMRLVR